MTTDPADARQALDIALRAAEIAGRGLMARFERPAEGITAKSTSTDLVSDADREAEHAILSIIRAERPGDAILSEESGEAEKGTTGLRWLVDPLDRTLEAFRLDGDTFRLVGTWRDDAHVRIEPFDVLELELSLLWRR